MLVEFKCKNCGISLEGESELSGGQMDCPNCQATLLVPHPGISIGSKIAGFQIEKKIGAGGMGDVYLATQISMERQVALKVLPPAMVSNPSNLKRFLYEIRMTGQLEHPNIVAVHDAGEFEGVYYLAMSFIDGESIGDRLENGYFFSEREALETIQAIAGALTFAWQKLRILHRDIKPANIMIDHSGVVKLLDLGLSKSLDSDMDLTQGNMVVGTPFYMSPDQANPLRDPDFRADMYSLGATAFHMLAGCRPYEGETPRDIILKAARGPVPSIRHYNPDVSIESEKIIQKMMAPRPEHRYQSWQDLQNAVNDLFRQQAEAGAAAVAESTVQQRPDLGKMVSGGKSETLRRSSLLPAAFRDSWRQQRKFKIAAVFTAVSIGALLLGFGIFKIINYFRGSAPAQELLALPEPLPPVPEKPEPEPVPLPPPPPARPSPDELRDQLESVIRERVRNELSTPEVQQEICQRLNLDWPVKAPLLAEPEIKLVINSKLEKAVEEKFPPTLRQDIEREAEERFGLVKVGDEVSLVLRGGVGHNPVASGRFLGMQGGYLAVGQRRVAISDLSRDDQVRFNAEASAKRQEQYVRVRLVNLEDEKEKFLKEQEALITGQVYRQANYINIGEGWRSQQDIYNDFQAREFSRRFAVIQQQVYSENGLVFRQGEWVYRDSPAESL